MLRLSSHPYYGNTLHDDTSNRLKILEAIITFFSLRQAYLSQPLIFFMFRCIMLWDHMLIFKFYFIFWKGLLYEPLSNSPFPPYIQITFAFSSLSSLQQVFTDILGTVGQSRVVKFQEKGNWILMSKWDQQRSFQVIKQDFFSFTLAMLKLKWTVWTPNFYELKNKNWFPPLWTPVSPQLARTIVAYDDIICLPTDVSHGPMKHSMWNSMSSLFLVLDIWNVFLQL